MAGPSTEYLAEQIDRLRDTIGLIKAEIQTARRESLDESRRFADIVNEQLLDLRENLARESSLAQIRNEVATGKEALKVEQSLIREDLARLQAETSGLISRFDKTQDFLKQLLFWLLGTVATLGGGLFWKATQAVNQLQDHGRRIETIEKSTESQPKIRDTYESIRTMLDERLPRPVPSSSTPSVR